MRRDQFLADTNFFSSPSCQRRGGEPHESKWMRTNEGLISSVPGKLPKLDFETAVRPELSVLYRVALRLTRNGADSEDLVQQTLIKAFRNFGKFDGVHLRSWLIRILRNEFASSVDRSAKMRAVELNDDAPDGTVIWNELVWRDQAHRILQEIDQLPRDHAVAVHLCDVEELSYEEAASALGVPVGTLKSRLSRARSMIVARLRNPALHQGDIR